MLFHSREEDTATLVFALALVSIARPLRCVNVVRLGHDE